MKVCAGGITTEYLRKYLMEHRQIDLAGKFFMRTP